MIFFNNKKQHRCCKYFFKVISCLYYCLQYCLYIICYLMSADDLKLIFILFVCVLKVCKYKYSTQDIRLICIFVQVDLVQICSNHATNCFCLYVYSKNNSL